MTFPDWTFIANNAVSLAIVLSPVELGALWLVWKMKRSLDLLLGPVQNNPLLKTVWAMMNWKAAKEGKSEKMTELGQRGLLARQIKVVEQEDAMVRYAGDPAKGFLVPILQGFGDWGIDSFGSSLPKSYRDRMKAQLRAEVPGAVELIPGNVTAKLGEVFVSQLEQRKPELAQELKAWLKLQESEKIGS